jgi:hypothetical protein
MVHELCRWVVRILKLGIRLSVVDPGFGLGSRFRIGALAN